MADVVRWPEWLPTVTAVEPLDSSMLAVGARFRILQPWLRPAIWSVVALEPPVRFSWESRTLGVRALADHILTLFSGDSTSITLHIALSGPLAALAGLLAGELTREYLLREAASLKQFVESKVANEPRAS